MNANHPLMRARLVREAFASVAVPGTLVLMACIVAALAFELENRWTLTTSLIVAAICSVVTVRNLIALQRRLNGIR
jgi:hypothetical protein